MPETAPILKIPTERDGVILKAVTALDDEAYVLLGRPFRHPAKPSHPTAPDHEAFMRLRKIHKNETFDKLNMGIWDIKSFDLKVFTGYVELRPDNKAEHTATVGCIIAERYRQFGYATTALRAIMQYGRQHLDIETYRAEVGTSNLPSQHMVERLGFECVGESYQRLSYVLNQIPEALPKENLPVV